MFSSAASVKDYDTAMRLLSKKRNPCEQTNAILEWLKNLNDSKEII